MTTQLEPNNGTGHSLSWRPLALFIGYICLGSLGFLISRTSLIVLASIFVFGAALTLLAYGCLRTARLSRRELALFLGGVLVIVLLICIPGVASALQSHWFLPTQPMFVWLALFHGTRDFLLWRAHGLPFPRDLNDNGRNV